MGSGGDFWRRRAADPAVRQWAAGILAWVAVPLAIIWAVLILVNSSTTPEVVSPPVVVTVMMHLSDDIYAVSLGDSPPMINAEDPTQAYNPYDDSNVTVVTLHGAKVADGQRLTLYRDDDGRLVDTPTMSGGDMDIGGTPRDWFLIAAALLVGIPLIVQQFARRRRESGNDHYARVRRRRRERDAAR